MEIKFYRCEVCGNIFGVINDAGVTPVCCGQDMTDLKPNTVDAAVEKHVPIITIDGNKVSVNVGEVEHPMTNEHYIQWIAVHLDGFTQRKALTPTDKPHVDFVFENAPKTITAYEYCNLHGLWKADK